MHLQLAARMTGPPALVGERECTTRLSAFWAVEVVFVPKRAADAAHQTPA
jgi:hypothetical protein